MGIVDVKIDSKGVRLLGRERAVPEALRVLGPVDHADDADAMGA
ncbi:MAG: hypothetical protein V4710_09270 [Verrucomicrobiota bacterium]